MNRIDLANSIFEKLQAQKSQLQADFNTENTPIRYGFVDDLLPEAVAQEIAAVFPNRKQWYSKKLARRQVHRGPNEFIPSVAGRNYIRFSRPENRGVNW